MSTQQEFAPGTNPFFQFRDQTKPTVLPEHPSPANPSFTLRWKTVLKVPYKGENRCC